MITDELFSYIKELAADSKTNVKITKESSLEDAIKTVLQLRIFRRAKLACRISNNRADLHLNTLLEKQKDKHDNSPLVSRDNDDDLYETFFEEE
jgi:hypothetical protein